MALETVRPVPEHPEALPVERRSLALIGAARNLAGWLARHWLALFNVGFLAVVLLAVLVPVLGAIGLTGVSAPLFGLFGLMCHQLPGRSFFLLGEQVAFCERDVAMYGAIAAAGLLFAITGWPRSPGMRWRWYFAALLPLALDGTTQLLGLRESTTGLRIATGTLFGSATVWVAYPRLSEFAQAVLEDLAPPEQRVDLDR